MGLKCRLYTLAFFIRPLFVDTSRRLSMGPSVRFRFRVRVRVRVRVRDRDKVRVRIGS